MLMMAVEVLIDPFGEPPEVKQKVENLISDVNAARMDKEDKDYLAERLGYLRSESIGRAGRRLVRDRLGQRTYAGKYASKFFTEAYKLRSRLVHGLQPFPTFQEVNLMAAPTQGFVSDLLTAPFLGNA